MKTMHGKKINRAALFLALAWMMLAVFGTAAADQEARRMETLADAAEWIAGVLGEHPEELDGAWAMSPQMTAAAAQLGGTAGFAKQLAALGTVQEIGEAYEGEVRGLKAFCIPCVFSAMSADLVVIVQDGAVAGLSTAPYSGEKKEEPVSDLFAAPSPSSRRSRRARRSRRCGSPESCAWRDAVFPAAPPAAWRS